jgi:hypothetical protein
MPDSVSPGHPLSPATKEDGTGTRGSTRRGDTVAAAAKRDGSQQSGKAAERVETRWRDIQWVDFSTGPDEGMETAAAQPAAPAATADTGRAAPEPGNALRYFAPPSPTAPASKSDAISGLVPRFTRLPVPRLPRTRGRSDVIQRRAMIFADASERAFPTSISTHVLEGLRPAAPKSRAFAKAWRITRPHRAAASRPPRATVSLFRRAIDRFSSYVAARGNRLRVPGLAALCVVGVALIAYVGGAVIARVAQPSSAPKPPAFANSAASSPVGAAPHDVVEKQLALADKVVRPETPEPAAAAPSDMAVPTDPVARTKFYIERAKAGDPVAQYDVGVLYAQGQGLVQDYASAANWFHAAAAQGNIDAEFDLGVLYAQGLGVPANPTEAINWYRSAADRGHPKAQFNLALAYATGNGTAQDAAAAARWYQRAAAHGVVPAMINLAILYETGDGVGRSLIEAYAWYSVAGECGDASGKARATALFQQFDDREKARAEGLAATIGAALDSSNGPANSSDPPA